jgi:hypothetical protein
MITKPHQIVIPVSCWRRAVIRAWGRGIRDADELEGTRQQMLRGEEPGAYCARCGASAREIAQLAAMSPLGLECRGRLRSTHDLDLREFKTVLVDRIEETA